MTGRHLLPSLSSIDGLVVKLRGQFQIWCGDCYEVEEMFMHMQ